VWAKHVAKVLLVSLALLGLWRWLQQRRASQAVEEGALVMGTVARVVAYGSAGRAAVEGALEVLRRWDELASRNGGGQLAYVNRAAGGRPVQVDPSLARLVAHAVGVARETGGAFEPTLGAVSLLWDFSDGGSPPDSASLARALDLVGTGMVRVDTSGASFTIGLARAGAVLDLGGVAKGWAADMAASRAMELGAWAVLVDAGGDLRLAGRKPRGPWRVGVRHPRRAGGILTVLELEDGAVATSGDYERFFEYEGIRYHHILDPSTGMPAPGSLSVTVVCTEAWRADALATALFVMGPEEALAFAERTAGVEVLVVVGELSVRVSGGLVGSVEAGFRPRWADFVVLGCVVLTGVAALRTRRRVDPGGVVVVSSQQGEQSLALQTEEPTRHEVKGPLGVTVVEVGRGKARITRSPCREKMCQSIGPISVAGDWAACIPNRVVIKVEAPGALDGVTH
jgi:thiamine biosynthesis lipoprotein